jgi:predicted DNA binding CopG/RHH family protein
LTKNYTGVILKQEKLKGGRKMRKKLYQTQVKVKVSKNVKELIDKRAAEKGMIISDYIRYLIYKDLEARYGEQIKQL